MFPVNVLEEDDDELMVEWFNLVSEKNDLVRQEADLVYQSREQDLESEQDHIECQLRYLMSLPDEAKSPEEKQEEDYLIQRKIDLVEQRDCIVNSMDEDRLRYMMEDKDIEVMLKDKGLWKDNGTLKALKGKKVARSKFYA
jgi:RNase P/RNase MRP subunit p30